MKSDNETKMISRNRVLAESKLMLFFILPLDLVLFFWFNYAINTVANLGKILKNIENAGDYMGIENVLPRLSQYTDTPIIAYLSWLIVLLVLDSIVIHQIRIMLDEDEMKHVIGHNQKPCIDNNKSNTSLYENTRLGMGEIPVYPTIDACEEGRTMVISEPKSDLYKSCGTTEERVEQEQ